MLGVDDPYPLPPRLQAVLDTLPLAELAFAPVPVRARHDGWTPARQIAFIHRLALCGSVGMAARAVGMTRKSVYNLRERAGAGSFAAAWECAQAMGQSGQLDRAIERSVAGEVRPVFYRGRKCGEHVRHNDGLTIAVLNFMERQRPGGRCWPRTERDPWDC